MNKQPGYKTLLVREMRQRQTRTEGLLWEELRARKIDGLKFRRQRPLDRFIADFCCDDARLIIEIDGSIHDLPDNKEYDAEREAYLRACGYDVLRFTTNQIENQMSAVIAKIHQAINATTSAAAGSPLPLRERGGGEG